VKREWARTLRRRIDSVLVIDVSPRSGLIRLGPVVLDAEFGYFNDAGSMSSCSKAFGGRDQLPALSDLVCFLWDGSESWARRFLTGTMASA